MNFNWNNWYAIGKIFQRAIKWTLKLLNLEYAWRSYKASKIPTKQIVYWTILNFTFYDCKGQINSNLDEWYDIGKLFPRDIK